MIDTQQKLELRLGEPQLVNMKVSAQILEHLSKGIYSNPARAVKELISNAFDADATHVIIRAKPELDIFSIHDNGTGMNYRDFEEKFLFISRSDKRDATIFSEIYKRPLIGKIGIGFVAVSQICNKMTVISSEKGDAFKFEALIDFGKFREIKARKKDIYELSEVSLTNYREEVAAHYTIVILTELAPGFKRYLEEKIETPDFGGKKFEQIMDLIEKKAEKSRSGFDLSKHTGRYWQMLLEVANTVPVRYMESGPIDTKKLKAKKEELLEQKLRVITQIKENVEALNFNVDFDGVDLRKPIRLPNTEDISKLGPDLDIFPFEQELEINGSELKFKGYLYNQKKSIYPPQFRGLVIRIKNTAIGGPDPGFLDYLRGDKLFFNWTFGEVYVEKGLEEAMNINRSSFTITHPHYQELRNYIHDLLQKQVFNVCRKRYVDRIRDLGIQQRKERKKTIEKQLQQIFDKPIGVNWIDGPSGVPLKFDIENRLVNLYTSHSIFRNVSKRDRWILENFLILLFVSYEESKGNSGRMLSYFLSNLDSVAEWG